MHIRVASPIVLARSAVLFAGVSAHVAEPLDAQHDDRFRSRSEQVDNYVSARLERGRIPGAALAIVHGDSIVHLRTFGAADPAGRPVTPDTPFILGSTTKPITATAVMMLVEAGRIELDVAAVEYLPWFRTADANRSADITVRQLLNHTSGVSGFVGRAPLDDGDTSDGALDRFVRSLTGVRLVRDPGSAFEYSNANYSVLGRIVQEISGQTFEAYVQQNIFDRLEMDHSYTSQKAAELDGLATGYRFWFGFPRPAPDMPFARSVAPAGYLMSTARDLSQYLTLHLNAGSYEGTNLISPAGIEELHRPAATMESNTSYAMGWVIQTDGEEITIWHNGGIPNFYSFLGMLPERRIGVVFLANGLDVLAAGQFDAIPLGVLDILRGRNPRVAADSRFHPPLNIAVFWALVILTWQVVWIVASVSKRRPWSVQEQHIPVSPAIELRKIGLPVVLNFGWAACVLSLIPGASGTPFSVMKLYVPDFGFFATASAVLAVVWGTAQVVLRVVCLARAVR